jgi:SAM-dependent methyltransferase
MSRDHDQIGEAAVSSTNLSGRIDANKRFAGADFEGWMRGLAAGLDTTRVLDICCGTGNQLVLYAAKPETAHLAGLDLSAESLDAARDRITAAGFAGSLDLRAGEMDTAFDQFGGGDPYDVISCCYGLYYARDVNRLLDAALANLTARGRIFIVGPWGPNNKSLFDLLARHVTLPDLVVSSATTFMTEQVLPFLEARASVRTETFVNPVRYPDVDAVLDYWRRTTFHDAAAEDAVRIDLEAVFAKAGEFTVEKHVMAIIAGPDSPA